MQLRTIELIIQNIENVEIYKDSAAIPLETTLHAFRNQEKTNQRSTIVM